MKQLLTALTIAFLIAAPAQAGILHTLGSVATASLTIAGIAVESPLIILALWL